MIVWTLVVLRRILSCVMYKSLSTSAMVGMFVGLYLLLGGPTPNLSFFFFESRILGSVFLTFSLMSLFGLSLGVEKVRRLGDFVVCLSWSYVSSYAWMDGPSLLFPVSLALVGESVTSYLVGWKKKRYMEIR